MTGPHNRAWSRDELLLALNLYCTTPFGRLHQNNPEIVKLSTLLGRSPGAVAMKTVNFASFDPALRARGVKGLSNASKTDEAIWAEFSEDSEKLAFESQNALLTLQGEVSVDAEPPSAAGKETERNAVTRVRLVQSFFRRTILSSYDFSCAMCEITVAELLVASHIISWSDDEKRRADPTNGICLCALHDRAFDRGFLGVDTENRVMLSNQLECDSHLEIHSVAFAKLNGKPIRLPERFLPDSTALAYHRERVFRA